jgi:hypothetical protein
LLSCGPEGADQRDTGHPLRLSSWTTAHKDPAESTPVLKTSAGEQLPNNLGEPMAYFMCGTLAAVDDGKGEGNISLVTLSTAQKQAMLIYYTQFLHELYKVDENKTQCLIRICFS